MVIVQDICMRTKKAAVHSKESESEIQGEIIRFFEKAGFRYIRHYMGAMLIRGVQCKNPNKGLPDLQVFLPDGRSIFMEVKDEHGKVSAEQKEWMDYLGDAGVPSYVVRSLVAVKNIMHKHLSEIAREAS